jgi:transcription elongation factor GreA-like protein
MRKPSDSVTLRNEYLLERIKDIKGEHLFRRKKSITGIMIHN